MIKSERVGSGGRRRPSALGALLLITLLALGGGCAPTHRVRVNAFLSQEQPFPAALEGLPVAVAVGSNPRQALLEREVLREIAQRLKALGCRVVPEEECGYLLTCWIGMDGGATRENLQEVYSPGFTYGYSRASDCGSWVSIHGYSPGYSTVIPYRYTIYTRFLGLTLYDYALWHSAEEAKSENGIVWQCDARSAGESTDLRSLAQFLIAAAFSNFGEDTRREIAETFKPDDPRLHALEPDRKTLENLMKDDLGY